MCLEGKSMTLQQKSQLERLKKDCAKELVNVEVAQRTKDTPPALQYENNRSGC